MARKKNTYFQFKHFTISQEHSAMKVSTDACIFGSLSAYQKKNCKGNLLDIGCGTGLLSLMWSQIHSDLRIDGIDADKGAYMDALKNCSNSPFSSRIQIFHSSLQHFTTDKKYDFIISNPPFFKDSLKNDSWMKSLARHADVGLSAEELFLYSTKLSHNDTELITLYPSDQKELLIHSALKHNWKLHHSIDIKSFPASTPHCTVFFWNKKDSILLESEFYIYSEKNQYSDEMHILLRDFYLHF